MPVKLTLSLLIFDVDDDIIKKVIVVGFVCLVCLVVDLRQ